MVDISRICKNVVGDVTFNIHYTFSDVIHTADSGVLELRLPMLAGFQYPVDNLEFTVTLPGQVPGLPGFVSGYHQARIEEHLSYQVVGATVSGKALQQLKDRETLEMVLPVSEEMFPQTIAHSQDHRVVFLAMGVCAAFALLYWLLMMRNAPVLLPRRSPAPPYGFTAGHMGTVAAGQGVDLTMMVFTWAQLGYVIIRVERQQRVLLQKRMDMGNERSEFEQRCFKKLFAARTVVDTASRQYAQLVLLCRQRTEEARELYSRRSGNGKVLRLLVAGLGLFGGVGLAVALLSGAALQGFFIVVLGIAGGISSWCLQTLGADILLGQWRRARARLVLAGFWLLLSAVAGALDLGCMMVLGTVAGGLLLHWGGRRSHQGRQALQQTCELKHYLRKPDKKQLLQLCKTNPDYFFTLAPYAMALGVDRRFAAGFGAHRLNGCPYLSNGIDPNMTALQWAALLRATRRRMDARAARLPLERFLGMVRSFRAR